MTDDDTPKRLRNFIRLKQNYFEHPVLMAAADEVPAAMHLWPILIGKGRMGAHPVDNATGAITTTLNRLARDAYVSIDDVGPALAQLQEGGLLTMTAEGQNVVRIVVRKLFPWQLMPGSSNARAAESKANASRHFEALGSGQAAGGQRVGSPEREEEREENKEAKASCPETSGRTEQIQNVFDYWCKVERETGGLGSNGRGRPPKLTKERKAKIAARLADGYEPADLKMAIAFYARDPHHAGDNDRSTRFTDLVTTLKNGAKVEAGVAGYESRGSTPAGVDAQKAAILAEYRSASSAAVDGAA